MSAVEGADAMDPLRQKIVTYFDHLILLLKIREQEFLQVPFPEDPTCLPEDFPDSECVHTFPINWNDDDYEMQLRHFYPEPGEQHLTWELIFKDEPQVQIGLLIVDRVVYEDPTFYRITGSIVLMFLGMAVGITKPVHIRKITLASANALHTLLEIIQIDSNGSPIEPGRQLPVELARREI